MGFHPTVLQIFEFIDGLDLQVPATHDFYANARVEITEKRGICHVSHCYTDRGLPPTEALNEWALESPVGDPVVHPNRDWRLVIVFAPLISPYLWWPSLYVILFAIHIITKVALQSPLYLFLLAFGAWKIPVPPCPILSPAANELLPVIASWLVLVLGQTVLALIDTLHPRHTKPQFIVIDSDATITSSDEESQIWTGPKRPPVNSHKALLGDICLDKSLKPALQKIGASPEQVGPLFDYLRSKHFQVPAGRKLGVHFPTLISGNPPSLHTLSTLVERRLVEQQFHKDFLKLALLEAGARLNAEEFRVPLPKSPLTL